MPRLTRTSIPTEGDAVPLKVTPDSIRLNERVRELHAAGLIDKEIAARVGIGRRSVLRRRGAMGLPPNGCHRWTAGEIRRIVAMAEAGTPHREIAAATGFNPKQIEDRIRFHKCADELDPQQIRSQALKSRAWDLFKLGHRPSAVARIVGVTTRTAYRYRTIMPKWWLTKDLDPNGVK